jgi:hypothetical protein
MKNKFGLFIYGIIMIAFASCKSPAMLAREKSIDDIVAKYASSNQPGASVLVFKDDKIVFQKGYGVRNIQTQEAIEPTTNFRLASVTKQFTVYFIISTKREIKTRRSAEQIFWFFPCLWKRN